MASADSNFKFLLTGNRDVPFLGYDSASDPTNLSAQYLVAGSKNVYRNVNGTVDVRPGLKRLGVADATEDGVVSSYEWRTALGEELPIRVLESGKMQVLFNDAWIDIATFVGSDVSFATWWDADASQDLLLMVNGDMTIKSWTGGIAVIASSTATTLTKTGTESWLEAGFTTTTLYKVTSATINDGGSGYAVGDKVYMLFGSTVKTPGVVRVDSVDASGVITGITLLDGGFNTTDLSAVNVTSTNGHGTGAKFNVTMANATKIILINGVEYSYSSGEYTTTLTGLSPSVASIAAGSIATQKVLEFNNQPNVTAPASFTPRTEAYTNDFIAVLANQLIVCSKSTRVVYISADTDYIDFSNSGDRVSGDPDYIVLDDFPNAIALRSGSAYISAGNSDWYKVTPNTPAPVAVPLGSDYGYVITAVEKLPGAAKTACFGFNFTDTIGDSIIYLGQDHQVRIIGSFRNLFQTKYPSISQKVRTELEAEDFTGGALRMIGEYLYITAPVSGKVYLHQIRDDVDEQGNIVAQRLWHPPFELGASRMAAFSGKTYVHSSSQPQVYQLWDTDQWHDDSPSDVPSPYECVARFAYQNNGLKTGLLSFNMAYYEGYLYPSSALNARVRFDYLGGTKNQGQQGVQEVVLSSLTEPGGNGNYGEQGMVLFIGESDAELGVSQVGTQQVGGTTNLLKGFPKFRAIQDIEPTDVYEYQMELYSYEPDARWSIKCLGTNATQSMNSPTYLRKG